MSEHRARVVQKATRRRGPYGGLHYYAECSCDYRSSPRDYAASAERDSIAHVKRERQADYVKAWRADHPGLVRDGQWTCPLCNQVIQGSAVGVNMAVQMAIQQHEQRHGQDYLDYMAAGQEPQ